MMHRVPHRHGFQLPAASFRRMLEAFGQAGTLGWQLVAGNWKLTRMPELRSETMTVNMGPQHPSTHGVLRIVLELSGETVVGADTTVGFLHTGIEKTAEQKKWQQVIPLVERMDYLGAQSNSLAFCLAVERLLGIEVPRRGQLIRVLYSEIGRLLSHLPCHDDCCQSS